MVINGLSYLFLLTDKSNPAVRMIVISLVLTLYFYPLHSLPAYSSPSFHCGGKFLDLIHYSISKLEPPIFREDWKIIWRLREKWNYSWHDTPEMCSIWNPGSVWGWSSPILRSKRFLQHSGMISNIKLYEPASHSGRSDWWTLRHVVGGLYFSVTAITWWCI